MKRGCYILLCESEKHQPKGCRVDDQIEDQRGNTEGHFDSRLHPEEEGPSLTRSGVRED